jgi:hypothetical protein
MLDTSQKLRFLTDDYSASRALDALAATENSEWTSAVLAKLHGLLSLHVADAEPQSVEARRRLTFFLNSLFMDMKRPPSLEDMLSWSVMTPYYSEDVLYSRRDLETGQPGSVNTMLYLEVSLSVSGHTPAMTPACESAGGSAPLTCACLLLCADAVQDGLEELPRAHEGQGPQVRRGQGQHSPSAPHHPMPHGHVTDDGFVDRPPPSPLMADLVQGLPEGDAAVGVAQGADPGKDGRGHDVLRGGAQGAALRTRLSTSKSYRHDACTACLRHPGASPVV